MSLKKRYKVVIYKKQIVFFILSIFLLTTSVSAQRSKQKLQEDKKKIETDIAFTNKLLSETKKDKLISLNQLIILNNKINQRQELIGTINTEISGIDGEIMSNSRETIYLSEKLKQLKEDYAKLVVFAYKNRNAFSRLMFLFASSDLNQAYLRLKYLQQYTSYRRKQADMIVKTALLLNCKISQLKNIKSGKTVLLKNNEDEKILLAEEKEEKNNSVKKLQQKEKDLAKTIQQKEKEAHKLQQSIEGIISDEIKKATNKSKTVVKNPSTASNPTTTKTVNVSETSKELGLSDADIKLSNSFASNKGKLPWPTEKGVVISTFGEHPHPILTNIKVKNNGVDISVSKGSKARSVFDGKVTGVISIPGANKAVIIRHGEYLTVYSNLLDVYVKTGDNVKTKQSIGLIFTDPEDSKTEFNFQVWYGKVLTDPLNWLSPK